MRFADVAVDAPAGHDRTFSYSVPAGMAVRPGDLVQVPFGSRALQGIAFSLATVPEVSETRDILGAAGHGPFLTDKQLALARWISRYYMSPLFDAAALMLPPGARMRSKTYLSVGSTEDGAGRLRLSAFDRRVLEYVDKNGEVEQERLVRTLGDGARAAAGRLVNRKILIRSAVRNRSSIGPRYREYAALAAGAREAAAQWLNTSSSRAPRRAALVKRLLDDDAPILLIGARKEYGAGAVSSLVKNGWIEKRQVLEERDPLAGKEFPPSPPAILTQRQAAVAGEINATLKDAMAVPRSFLLQGVTGSGKTEVYLDAVATCLRLGKRAIVMVPEIALTHQTVERFAARFPGRVAVLHSGLTAGQRFDQWWRIKRGDFSVVIGSRGALFAPLPDLGLVVIDEEHEWTYKQHDASPRYHARDAALKLSELTGTVVVMGSASPDLVPYHDGLRGRHRLLTLPDRVSADGGRARGRRETSLSPVDVVDMRRELREGNRDIFSRALSAALGECLGSKGQAILLLNRRGRAAYMRCLACGFGIRCGRCDVPLTYHKYGDRLICHFCGQRRIPPTRCPECLGYRLAYRGAGTEAVVEAVSRRFPDMGILRWDSDATGSPGAHEELLSRFRSGEARVLVGTQMIAKGLHFPGVTLVGVVLADIGLNIPDYRSGERVFQLLCQVAGRAGRGGAPGRVIIQTYQPDNYAIQAAAAQNYRRFYGQEIAFRRQRGNPPHGKLIRLLYAHTSRAICEREATRFSGVLRNERESSGYSEIELLGPMPAFPARMRGRYRWHLILRGPEPRALLDRVTIPRGWTIDIDPAALT